MQKIQQMQMLLQKGPIAKAQSTQESNKVKLITSREKNVTELAKMDKKHVSEARQMLVQHLMDMEQQDQQREGEVEDRNFGAVKEIGMAREASKAKASAKS